MIRNSFPNPRLARNLFDWAMKVYEYQTGAASVSQEVDPQPVLLAHQTTDGDTERAATDGILMYSPTDGTLVVSVGGVWKTVTLDP